MKKLDVPVVFIIFNRPDLTQRVFDVIRKVQPQKLLVIADGPRFPEEEKKCTKTRNIIDTIDWECEVFKNYSSVNLSSPIRCSSGLNWVFSQVEEAIILEDDCLPSACFFDFCKELLSYYKDNERVMHISGSNFFDKPQKMQGSYCFSKYGTAWGWATWSRAWQYFDFEMRDWWKLRDTDWIKKIHPNLDEQQYWSEIFDRCTLGNDPHWDYAWMFTCWLHQGLSVIPSYNLVSNIGCRHDGTRHTSSSDLGEMPLYDLPEIEHPPEIKQDVLIDYHLYRSRFNFTKTDSINLIGGVTRFTAQLLKLPINLESKRFIKTILGKIKRAFVRPKLPYNNETTKICLHLGCGPVNHPQFINIDLIPAPHVHYVRSISNLKPFRDNSVDLIYASHCIETFSPLKIPDILSEWYRVLKPGGIVRIAVPDFDKIIELYLAANRNIEVIRPFLMGEQNHKLSIHMSIFNRQSLSCLLKQAGFINIQEWHPGSSAITNMLDRSRLLVYVNAKMYPISLNLEAIKK